MCRDWARRNLPPEGAIIQGRRQWFAAFLLWPGRVLRALYWLHVEPLPGDRFWDICRDRQGEYIGGGKIAVASRQMVVGYRLGADWYWNLPDGAVAVVEPWEPWRWQR